MMTHEERARFVRQQIMLARIGADASGTGASTAQTIIDCWEAELNETRTDAVDRMAFGGTQGV
jgi:hypothetical protein